MSNPQKQEGIDVRLAMEILSMRSSEQQSQVENGGCHHNPPEGSASMGQIIDLVEAPDKAQAQDSPENEDTEQRKRQKVEQEREKRAVEMQRELESMSVKELLKAVLEAQQERVATYREYDRGLKAVLDTGNLSLYPSLCAEATASFSVVSDTINSIQKVLNESRSRQDLGQLLSSLQEHEKTKLNLVAALHLEKIGVRGEQVDVRGGDERILSLLRDGVSSLEEKIAACIEDINETLEEIRCCMMDES